MLTTSGALRVKAPILLLLALIIACLGVAFLPASVHAEGFFSRTVKCFFVVSLLTNCQAATDTSIPAKTPPQNSPVTNDSTQKTPPSAAPYTGASQPGVAGEPLPMPDTTLRPRAPLVGGENVTDTKTVSSVAHWVTPGALVASAYSTPAQGDEAFLMRSETGWKIAGTPWFLWAIGILGLAGVLVSVKRLNLSKKSTLPNR